MTYKKVLTAKKTPDDRKINPRQFRPRNKILMMKNQGRKRSMMTLMKTKNKRIRIKRKRNKMIPIARETKKRKIRK